MRRLSTLLAATAMLCSVVAVVGPAMHVRGGGSTWYLALGDSLAVGYQPGRGLTAHGYDASRHSAQQFEKTWFDEADVVLAMDADNLADLEALRPGDHEHGRLLMFRDFDPRSGGDHDRDVPDPYYGGDDGFENVLAMVERTSDAIVAHLARVVDG